ERQREAEAALAVRDAEEPVLAPAVDAAAGVVVREVVPAGAIRRVVLPNRPPLPLGEIRPPALPVPATGGVVRAPRGLRVVHGARVGACIRHGSTISRVCAACRRGACSRITDMWPVGSCRSADGK